MGMIDQLKARRNKTANTYWHDWWGKIWDNVHGAGSAYSGRPCLGCG